ncbi:MAG: cytidylate kinase-like family protein [Pirellulales bacterium]
MRVLTIAREYGAGGGELAHKLAEVLGWTLLGRELLQEAARVANVPDVELEGLDEKAVTIGDRFRLHPPHQKYLKGLTEAVRRAADRGQVILLGRGAAHLLAGVSDCFHLRLVAPKAWRVERMAQRQGWTAEEALARCTEIDRSRQQFNRYFFGAASALPAQFDLVVNSARVSLDEVTAVIRAIASAQTIPAQVNPEGKRVLTLSRELGAGDQGFAPPVAERLGLQIFDRELLEEEAQRLGVSAADLEKIDERPAGIFQRFRPGSIHHRYFEALGQLMRELADRGNVLLMGRGGFRFLRDHTRAFHVRLVAGMSIRLRRVMEYRWVREDVAKELIARSDAERRSFCEDYFGADGASPLEYHITVNSGRLGASAIDLVAAAASCHWERALASP